MLIKTSGHLAIRGLKTEREGEAESKDESTDSEIRVV